MDFSIYTYSLFIPRRLVDFLHGFIVIILWSFIYTSFWGFYSYVIMVIFSIQFLLLIFIVFIFSCCFLLSYEYFPDFIAVMKYYLICKRLFSIWIQYYQHSEMKQNPLKLIVCLFAVDLWCFYKVYLNIICYLILICSHIYTQFEVSHLSDITC